MDGESSYRRFLDGDDSGIIPIIRDYKDGLVIYINSFTLNTAISEELMEEVFVKLVIKKPSFRGESSFKTWLYSVARNTALDYLRDAKNHEVLSLDESYAIECSEDIEREYLRSEQRIMLKKAMERLKSEYYQVLCLVYFENFKNREVAKIMKKSRRQIENLIYRAKGALRKELEKEGCYYE